MALSTNLLAYYKFDDGSGSTVTDAIGSFNGSWLGTGGHWTTGKINGGGSFNGTDDYVNLGSTLSLQAANKLSVSAWVNITDFTNYHAILYTNNSNAGYALQTLIASDTGAGFVRFFTGTTANILNSTVAIPTSTWTHLVGVYDGASHKIYINGQLNNSNNLATSITDSGVNKYLGSLNGTQQMFLGSMDEVGIWSRDLTQSEVTQLYGGGSGWQYPFVSIGSSQSRQSYISLLFHV